MKPLPFVWPYAAVFWGVFLWAFLPEFGIVGRAVRRVAATESPDAGSMKVILLGMQVAFFLAFPLASVRAFQVRPAAAAGWLVAGTLMLIAGSLLRRHCWRMLGSSFTGDIAARPDQPVIDRGAYAWVRHPSYSGGTLMNVGVGVALGSWASALLLLVMSLAVYSYRIAVEERVLLRTIGEPYRRYIRGRRRLVPFLY